MLFRDSLSGDQLVRYAQRRELALGSSGAAGPELTRLQSTLEIVAVDMREQFRYALPLTRARERARTAAARARSERCARPRARRASAERPVRYFTASGLIAASNAPAAGSGGAANRNA